MQEESDLISVISGFLQINLIPALISQYFFFQNNKIIIINVRITAYIKYSLCHFHKYLFVIVNGVEVHQSELHC